MGWVMPQHQQLLLAQLRIIAGGRMDFVLIALREGGDFRQLVRRILEQRQHTERAQRGAP